MRPIVAAVLGTSVLWLTSPALAQDTAQDQPYSGVYVGGSLGYAVQPNDIQSKIAFDKNLDGTYGDTVTTATGANAFSPGFCNGQARGSTPSSGCRNDKDGIEYYGRVGIDKQFGPIVAGVLGEFGKANIRDSVSAFSTTPASYIMNRSLRWEAGLRARLGYAANTTLFYATGGGGYADIDRSFATTNTANAFGERGRRRQFGFTAGGGLEQKIGRNFSIGMEYLFHQYDDKDYRVRATAGTAPATNPFVLAPNTTGTDFRRTDPKFRWNSLRAVAGFRF